MSYWLVLGMATHAIGIARVVKFCWKPTRCAVAGLASTGEVICRFILRVALQARSASTFICAVTVARHALQIGVFAGEREEIMRAGRGVRRKGDRVRGNQGWCSSGRRISGWQIYGRGRCT